MDQSESVEFFDDCDLSKLATLRAFKIALCCVDNHEGK
jgi:hypothetical protein